MFDLDLLPSVLTLGVLEAGLYGLLLVPEQFQQVHEEAGDRILVIDKGTIVADRRRRGAAVQERSGR